MIDESLLKLLVCPQSKAPLKQVEDELICMRLSSVAIITVAAPLFLAFS
jgi:uncharacterized protein YbaR (Trm112 family)